MITTKIGGMETTMNIEISKPTQYQNDKGNDSQQDTSNPASNLQATDIDSSN